MTLEEKIGQMNQLDPSWDAEEKEALIREGRVGSVFNIVGAKEINRLQRMAVEESRLGIPLIAARDVIHGFRTIWPIPLGQAATWNPGLIEQAAAHTAEEAVSAGIRWTFSPMVDVARDPRWGRIAEGYGEDTRLTSLMAAATVRGYQSNSEAVCQCNDLSAKRSVSETVCQRSGLKMAACVKHFAGYSASEGGRDYNTTWIPETQLRDVYLPPFKAALDAGCASVMCSFNDLNGLPSSANPHLNIDILRNEWHSDALLVSDWGSGSDLVPHGLCADKKEAALRCINARMEMDMQGNIYTDYLAELINEKMVNEKMVNDAVRSVLRLKYRLGLFDNPYVPETEPVAYTDEALALATELVEQSTVLLKNNGILPLNGKMVNDKMVNVLVTGPLADQKKEQLGTWVFDAEPEHSVTPLEALQAFQLSTFNFQLLYEPGLAYSRDKSTSGFAKAVEAARRSDVILFFAGEEAILSGEARCRADISLPGAQSQLLAELHKTGKPIVLIVMAGPGLANILTGKAVPSGRLPVTFPKMVGQIPLYYNRHNTGRPSYDPPMLIDSIPIGCPQFSIGQSSYWLETPTEPLFPFGYGLSYTTFEYGETTIDTIIDQSSINRKSYIIKSSITNTGSFGAYEVPQLYVRQLSGALVRPIKELKYFSKILLQPGETRTVEWQLTPEDLGYWHEKHTTIHPTPHTIHYFDTDNAEYEIWIAPNSDCRTQSVIFHW